MAIEGLNIYRRTLQAEIEMEFAASVTAEKRQVALVLFDYLVKGTPIDEGEARQGWHFSLGAPTGQNIKGGDPVADLARILGNDKAWTDPLFIQNNVPHAPILEFGLFDPRDPGPSKDPRPGRKGKILVAGGFSTQAPKGITGDAIQATARQFGLQQV